MGFVQGFFGGWKAVGAPRQPGSVSEASGFFEFCSGVFRRLEGGRGSEAARQCERGFRIFLGFVSGVFRRLEGGWGSEAARQCERGFRACWVLFRGFSEVGRRGSQAVVTLEHPQTPQPDSSRASVAQASGIS